MGSLGTRKLAFASTTLLLLLLASGLSAQWPETFTSQGQLPAGWEHSPGGAGTTQWNVDANGNYRPSAPLQGNFDPFRTGQFSLNWNDSVKAYPDNTSGPLERGVLTPVIDVTFAPNPELSFWTLWDRWNTTSDYHIMRVRVWNTNYSIMHYTETMPTAGGLTPWHNRTIPLNRNWGQIRIEFYYKCGPLANTEKNAAGWFIDDVDVTGLTPPAFGINQQNSLGTHTTGSNISIQLSTSHGTLPDHSWQVTAGNLPQGVTISGSGLISGIPTDAGIFNFTIQAQDSSTPPAVASKSFFMTVNRGPGFVYPVKTLPFEDTFSSDEGWVYSTGNATPQYGPSLGGYSDVSQGGWERGPTSASPPASPNDNGDPPADNTPTTQDNMVMAVVAGGPIPSSLQHSVWYWAYSPQIEVAGIQEVEVFFHRWMNCYNTAVHKCEVQIWNPNSNVWMNVWTMATGQELSTQWIETRKEINFGTSPAANATTRLRFGYQVTNASAYTTHRGGGFTVDDVKVFKKPQPNILRMLDFTIVSPHPPVGAYPRMYVGNSYPMLILLENTSTENIALVNYAQRQESVSGPPPYTPENVGHIVPTTQAPWIIPPGVHYLTYDPANPPSGAGPEIEHFDFLATAIPTTGSGGSVIYNLQLFGQEVGGNQRAVVANSETDPAGNELIHVMTVPPLALTDPQLLPDATVGVPYMFALTAQNGTTPYHSWQILSGPTWMFMVDNELHFTATPNEVPNPPQSFQVTIEVSDSATTPATANKTFTVNVLSSSAGLPPLQIVTPSQLPNAKEDTPYSAVTLNASGGQPPYSWGSFSWLGPPAGQGTLTGITFDSVSHSVSGLPASGTYGGYAFTVTLSDDSFPVPQQVTRTFYLSVLPANDVVSITTPTSVTASGAPPVGLETAPYNNGLPFKFEATGGFFGPPGNEYLWSIGQGELPPGLNLNANTGELTGTATVPGQFVFALRAADGAFPPNTGTAVFTIFVDALVPNPLSIKTVSNLGQADENNHFQLFLQGQYGITPYSWSLKPGSDLPLGLSLNPQSGEIGGVIIGGQAAVPNEDFNFTIVIQDSAPVPATAEKMFTLNIVAFIAGALQITTAEDLPQGGVQSPYSTVIRATGGNSLDPVQPYAFGLAPGEALPNGLTLALNGRIDGVPQSSGSFTFIIECTDGTTGFETKSFNLQINGGAGGSLEDAEIIPGKKRTTMVPFWEACSGGTGAGSLGVLALLGLGIYALRSRRRKNVC